jgi:hypothetical protein
MVIFGTGAIGVRYGKSYSKERTQAIGLRKLPETCVGIAKIPLS